MVNPSTLTLLWKGNRHYHPLQYVNDKIGKRWLQSTSSITGKRCDSTSRKVNTKDDGSIEQQRIIQPMMLMTNNPRMLQPRPFLVTPSLRHVSSMTMTIQNKLCLFNTLQSPSNNVNPKTTLQPLTSFLRQSISSFARSNMIPGTHWVLSDDTHHRHKLYIQPIHIGQQSREFSVKAGRKTIARERKKQIERAKKQGNYPSGSGKLVKKKKEEVVDGTGDSLQHLEWVQFQREIAVGGFETGQTTIAVDSRKVRGGALARKKRERKLAIVENKLAERRRLTEGGSGLFPPLRYSDEETERLLNMAYAALPERTGKRGTRSLKRQKRRWELVRQIRRTYKGHLANFQERKMYKRSEKIQQIKFIKQQAPVTRLVEHQYQTAVLQKWWSSTHG